MTTPILMLVLMIGPYAVARILSAVMLPPWVPMRVPSPPIDCAHGSADRQLKGRT